MKHDGQSLAYSTRAARLFRPILVIVGTWLFLFIGILAAGAAWSIVQYFLHSIGQWPDY